MVPATGALLSPLALKPLDKERKSHISDFNFDEAIGLFTGLDILPKATFATDYSYRTRRHYRQRLLMGWISGLAPVLFPEGRAFCLDFHPIPYRGDPTGLDTHYIATRGTADPPHCSPSFIRSLRADPNPCSSCGGTRRLEP